MALLDDSASGIEGLLGNPLFTGGLGLLAGALDNRTSTGQDILGALQGAQQGVTFRQSVEAERLQNKAAREQLEQASRQRKAQKEIFEMLSAQPNARIGTGAGLLTPQEAQQGGLLDLQNPQTLKVFAEAFPSEAGGLIADSFSQTTEPTIPVAGGRLPITDLPNDTLEALVAESLSSGGTLDFNNPQEVESLLSRVDSIRGREKLAETIATQQAALEAQKTLFEAQQEQFKAENMQLKRDSVLKEAKSNALDVARSLRNLLGTAAAPGGFELSRDILRTMAKAKDLTPQLVQELTGVNVDEATRLVGVMETFSRESKGNLVLNLKKLSEFGINPTDRKTGELAKLTPSMENQPSDNIRNTLKILRAVKESTEATPGEVWGDDRIEKELQKEISLFEDLAGVGSAPGTVTPPGTNPSRIFELPGGSVLSNPRSE